MEINTANMENDLEKLLGMYWNLNSKVPVMLVFLRHTGCMFCREALQDISRVRSKLEGKGVKIVLVNLSDEDSLISLLEKYNLQDLMVIQDKERRLYQYFKLNEFRAIQLLNPKIIFRGIGALMNKNFQSKPTGVAKQLSGMFLIYEGKVIKTFYQVLPSDRPDYAEFGECIIN